ncbi:MAG: hypothetical protein WAL63_12835, partial [Solirubrobacteraceae bacterium]
LAMKIVATGYGGPDVLQQVPHDDRSPEDGEVAIAVRAAGVNPATTRVGSSWLTDQKGRCDGVAVTLPPFM